MTSAQDRLYWREWAACREALLALGYEKADEPAMRHTIHVRALGADKSHTALTNPEFDKILSAFRGYSQPGNLREQLRIQDQPEQRLTGQRSRARKLCTEIGVEPHGLEAYLDHLARQICNRSCFEHCDEIEAARICGTLEVQAHRVRRRAARTREPVSSGNPF